MISIRFVKTSMRAHQIMNVFDQGDNSVKINLNLHTRVSYQFSNEFNEFKDNSAQIVDSIYYMKLNYFKLKFLA